MPSSALHPAVLFNAFRPRILMFMLFALLGAFLPFHASSAMLWVTLFPVAILIIYANPMLGLIPSFTFPSLTQFLRSIPRHKVFGILIKELTIIVKRQFPDSSPLEENSARTLIFTACKFIYGYTGDVVSGSLACTILISYLISPHETPIWVFVVWFICVVYMVYMVS